MIFFFFRLVSFDFGNALLFSPFPFTFTFILPSSFVDRSISIRLLLLVLRVSQTSSSPSSSSSLVIDCLSVNCFSFVVVVRLTRCLAVGVGIVAVATAVIGTVSIWTFSLSSALANAIDDSSHLLMHSRRLSCDDCIELLVTVMTGVTAPPSNLEWLANLSLYHLLNHCMIYIVTIFARQNKLTERSISHRHCVIDDGGSNDFLFRLFLYHFSSSISLRHSCPRNDTKNRINLSSKCCFRFCRQRCDN